MHLLKTIYDYLIMFSILIIASVPSSINILAYAISPRLSSFVSHIITHKFAKFLFSYMNTYQRFRTTYDNNSKSLLQIGRAHV